MNEIEVLMAVIIKVLVFWVDSMLRERKIPKFQRMSDPRRP